MILKQSLQGKPSCPTLVSDLTNALLVEWTEISKTSSRTFWMVGVFKQRLRKVLRMYITSVGI